MADRREVLERARVYLCVGLRPDLGPLVSAVAAAGVGVVQLRHKHLEAAAELAALAVVGEACRAHGALLSVNDRADLAVVAGADVLHLGQDDLTPAQARAIVGPDVVIGRSTHDERQADEAIADPDVDYLCTGPVWATPTKPGRAATGLALVRHVAGSATTKPWFAIGGVDEATIAEVVGAGARRVVVVRALTEAADPAGAARRLRAALP